MITIKSQRYLASRQVHAQHTIGEGGDDGQVAGPVTWTTRARLLSLMDKPHGIINDDDRDIW